MSPSPTSRLLRAALVLSVAMVGVAIVATPAHAATLTQVSSFGSNPGNLTMYAYRPDGLAASAPAVVLLHGCTQNATTYFTNSGWRKYADAWGFALVVPEQKSGNNALSCFNWFQAADTTRGQGEVLSIKQMVDYSIANFGVAAGRVYVSGLSAGGAMSAAMLSTYPDVFAAGSVVAGIPYGCGTSCQYAAVNKTPQQWGDLVRNAFSGYGGPYPKVAIWQGQSDSTVVPANGTELATQWTNVRGVSATPTATVSLPGNTTMEQYGSDVVRLYKIAGMGHGTPVDPGSAIDQCGTAASYFLDTICSAYRDAVYFGLDNTAPPTPPGVPTGLAVSGTTNVSVALSWNAVAGATGYNVYRNATKVTASPVVGTTYTDTGLSAATSYGYTIRAVNSAGEGSPSATVTATTSATPPPGPSTPTGLTITGTTDSTVTLSWNASSGATGYFVYRDAVRITSSPIGPTTFTDTGRTAATTYSYRVSAVGTSGAESPQSTAVSATTATVVCFTASNYAQVVAGRAHHQLGYVYANGSNQAMGLYNTYYRHTLKQTGPNYWVVADGQC